VASSSDEETQDAAEALVVLSTPDDKETSPPPSPSDSDTTKHASTDVPLVMLSPHAHMANSDHQLSSSLKRKCPEIAQARRMECQQDTTIHHETYTHRQPQRLASTSFVESDDDDAWIRNLWKRLPTFYTSAPTRQSRRRRCEIIFSVANQCKLPLDKAAALIVKTELEYPHVQWA